MRNLFYGMIFLLITVVGLIPKLASTALGKSFFIKKAHSQFDREIKIGSMKFTWLGPQVFKNVQLSHSDLECDLEEFRVNAPFWSISGPFEIKNAFVTFQGHPIDSFNGTIKGNQYRFYSEYIDGHIFLKGKLHSKLDFSAQVDIEQLPIDQNLDEILGPKLDLFASITMQEGSGPIDLTIATENLEATIHGFFSKDVLTLQEPLIAHLNLTENMSEHLLKNAGSLFLNGISNTDPIVLRVEPEGFSLSLNQPIEHLTIAKGSLDLGRCKCHNNEALAAMIGILKRDRLGDYNTTRVWLTPFEFSVANGIIQTGRVDALLANTIHVCTWGKIDLLRDKLDMTLGLTETTLRRSFKIKNLPKEYVLTVDLSGSTIAPEIQKANAAAKIATLIGNQKLEKRGALGSLASIFLTPKVEENIPEPIHPLPWD